MSARMSDALLKTTLISFLLLAPPVSDAVEKKSIRLQEDKSSAIIRIMSDGWRKGTIDAAFLLNKNIDSQSLKVSVENQTAILEGSARSAIEKSLAQEIALSVEGIQKVKNNINIIRTAKTPKNTNDHPKPSRKDILLTTKINQKLLTNKHLSNSNISVHATKGVVELSGVSPSDSTKDLAFYLVKNVKGVISVDNKIKVRTHI